MRLTGIRLTGRKMKLYVAVGLLLCAIGVLKTRAQQSKEYVNRQVPMVHMAGLLRLVETIPLPTEGYMDHLSYDLKNQHLFLPGENNKEVVVVDMKAGKGIQEVKAGGNPRNTFFTPTTNDL